MFVCVCTDCKAYRHECVISFSAHFAQRSHESGIYGITRISVGLSSSQVLVITLERIQMRHKHHGAVDSRVY